MSTITKKDLVDRIVSATGQRQVLVKEILQTFLDNVILELGKGNRLELRDFGVFQVGHRKARTAQNPKTLRPVTVPPRRVVKFKPGRLMKQTIGARKRASS
jgi:integration host factor subunit beta